MKGCLMVFSLHHKLCIGELTMIAYMVPVIMGAYNCANVFRP